MNRRHFLRKIRCPQGYSLLEMTLVLLILSILASMFLSVQIAIYMDEKRDLTLERMEEIQKSIIYFRQVNFRVPCPARGELTIASIDYGKEAANPGSCTGGGPAADYTAANLAVGTIPTKILGLADDYMYDGWGRKFTYIVDPRATGICAFTTYNVLDTTIGFTILDASDTARSDNAWYGVLSHGFNGHGAFLSSGERLSADSTNANELLNCHCDADGGNTGLTRSFMMREVTESSTDIYDRFDDLLVYAGRQDIRSPEDEAGVTETCP